MVPGAGGVFSTCLGRGGKIVPDGLGVCSGVASVFAWGLSVLALQAASSINMVTG